jgi:hypothetical protein
MTDDRAARTRVLLTVAHSALDGIGDVVDPVVDDLLSNTPPSEGRRG